MRFSAILFLLLPLAACSTCPVSSHDGSNMRALGAIRALASAEDTYYSQHGTYISCGTAAACAAALPGMPAPPAGVALSATSVGDRFTAESSHSSGDGAVYRWDSRTGLSED